MTDTTTTRPNRRTRTIAVTAAAAALAASAVAASGVWAVAAAAHPASSPAPDTGWAAAPSGSTARAAAATPARRPRPGSHHGNGSHNGNGSYNGNGHHGSGNGSYNGGMGYGNGSQGWPGMHNGMNGGMGYGNGPWNGNGNGSYNGGTGYGNGAQGSQGWPGGMMGGRPTTTAASCTVPAATGTQVRYVAMDMGSMMGGSMMRLMPMWNRVPAGKVTLDLFNRGTMPHELLVFPLASGQVAGQRTVGSDDRVSEDGMLGEVEPVCDQGQDVDGIAVGNVGQVTLTLQPGRYEIVCNLPGHYRNGMFATLVVV